MANLNDQDIIQQLEYSALPEEAQKNALVFFYATVQARVGRRIEQQLSEDQLKQFSKFAGDKESKAALEWLNANAPGYDAVVTEEVARLVDEVKSGTQQVMDLSKQPDTN